MLVADDLILQDGQLQVQQTPEAVLDPDTDQWSIQLTCGVFNFHGSPLFSVEWTVSQMTFFEMCRLRLLGSIISCIQQG